MIGRNVAEALATLGEGLSAEGAARIALWLGQALSGRGSPRPELLVGMGAVEWARGLVVAAVRDGIDLPMVPWSWIATDGALPNDLPRAAVLTIDHTDEPDQLALDRLAARTWLLVAGDCVVPLIPGGDGLYLLDLPEERVTDLWLLDAAGWPASSGQANR